MVIKRLHSMAFDIILVAFLCVAIVLPSAILFTVVIIGDVMKADLVVQTQQTLDFNYQLVRFQVNRARLTLEALAEIPEMQEALLQDFNYQTDPVPFQPIAGEFDSAIHLVKFLENITLQKPGCEIVVGDSGYRSQNLYDFYQSAYCRGYGHEESAYISAEFVSAITGKFVMVMSVPIKDKADKEIGFISAVLDVGDLSLYLSNLQQSGQFTILLDRSNQVLIDTRSIMDAAAKQENLRSVVNPSINAIASGPGDYGVLESVVDGEDVVVAYNKYEEYPGQFTLINVQPRSLAYHLQNKIILILSLSGLGMVSVLVLALWVTVRLSTRRLNQITSTIQNIAGGKEDERLPEKMFASFDEVGTLGRSFNQMIDRIHETKSQLQNAKAKSDAILLGIGDGVVAIDTQGKIILFNRAAEQISGLAAADILGKPYRQVLKFVRGTEQVPEDGFIRRALSGSLSVMPDDVSLIRADKTLVPVADASGPVLTPNGQVIGAVIVFRDVTHEREVDHLKSEFVSVASHQLRTPLTAIRWYLEDLQSEEIGTLTKEQKVNVDQAVQSTGRMIHLVNDLLNVSRLESGRLSVRPQSTNIATLIQDVVQENQGSASAKKCSIVVNLPKRPMAPIMVDAVLVRQVVTNLLSNAIKYADPKVGKPNVEVTLSQDGQKYYRVSMKDNGVGISAKDQERIFQRFFRADNAVKMQAEGSGLGLYIAKLIVEASGGMIAFDSKEGEGSTFWFLLPIAGSKEHAGGKNLTT